jgi:ubiquinone/menaquinone biosynthesis C-methylase UbiE
MTRLRRVAGYCRERGIVWSLLYSIHYVLAGILRRLKNTLYRFDLHIIQIEKQRCITGDATVSNQYHTIEENARHWNSYDWSDLGEEWTRDANKFKGVDPAVWKSTLVESVLLRYIPPDSTILEIGPGAGRWTELLQPLARRLILADITEKCLLICRDRFRHCSNLEYHLIDGPTLRGVPDGSVDRIWSYDVFIHVNPNDTDRYLAEFRRVLKPGGHAIIHHPGTYRTEEEARKSWRSFVDGRFFAHLVQKYGLSLVEQNDSLAQKPGDVITIFAKPELVAGGTGATPHQRSVTRQAASPAEYASR